MNQKRVNVAIIGLGFGAEFIPIYQKHPQANMYAICQRNAERLDEVGETFGVENATPATMTCWRIPTSTSCTSTAHPRSCPDVDRRAEGGQARDVHRAHGHER